MTAEKNDAPRSAAAYVKGPESQPTPCPVAYCRAVGSHGLHDIPACLRTCGPLRPGQGREHDPACPNAKWVRADA